MASSSVFFRPVTAQNRDLLLRIYASTRERELALVPWDAGQKSLFLQHQFAAQNQHYGTHFPEAEYSIVVHNGEDAGRILITRDPARIHVLEFTVLPEHRGCGIGTEIVRWLQEEARSKALPLTTYLDQLSDSQAWLEKRGFTRISDEGMHYKMQWKPSGETSGLHG
jgi:GNAT superfamily N-acetyltransferase